MIEVETVLPYRNLPEPVAEIKLHNRMIPNLEASCRPYLELSATLLL